MFKVSHSFNMSQIYLIFPCVVMLGKISAFSFSTGSCKSGYVSCFNGENWRVNETSKDSCIRESDLCDHESDCSDGSDEKFCPDHYNYGVTEGFSFKFVKGPCDRDFYLCPKGTHWVKKWRNKTVNPYCIHKNWICDHEKDCNTVDDEAFCPYNEITGFQFKFNSTGCPDGFVNCRNGTAKNYSQNSTKNCIKQSSICNGVKDCKDGLDELYCPYMYPSNIPDLVQTTSPPNNEAASFQTSNPNIQNNLNMQTTKEPLHLTLLIILIIIGVINTLLILGSFIKHHINRFFGKRYNKQDLDVMYESTTQLANVRT